MSKDGLMFSLHEDDYGMDCDYWCQEDDVFRWLDASGLPSSSHSPSSITMDIRTRGRENGQQFLLNPQIDHRRWRRNNNRWWRNIYPCMIILIIIINAPLTRGLKCLHSSDYHTVQVGQTELQQYQNVDVVRLKEERIYLLGMGVLVFRKWVVCQVAVSWVLGTWPVSGDNWAVTHPVIIVSCHFPPLRWLNNFPANEIFFPCQFYCDCTNYWPRHDRLFTIFTRVNPSPE